MLMKKGRKLYAMALTAAMLLTSVNPVTAHAEDAVVTSTHNHGTFIVTADLMDDKGVVTLENLNWDKIEIPSDLGAKKVVLKNVIAAELVIESDTSCEFEISGGTITKLEVAASEEKDMDLRDMAKLIADGMSKSKAQEEYAKSKKEAKEKKSQGPVITLKDKAAVGTIEVAGNASLSLKDGKVDKLQVVSGNADSVKLTVDGFNGTLTVDQNGKEFGVVELELKNSKPAKAEINSNGKGSIVLNGEASVIAEAVVNGSASLVLAVETKKLETAKESKDVELVVLASVEEVVVNGEATDVNVATGAVVKKAVINGANATVEGKGKVEKAAVSSDTAKVETKDTEVYDPATATATPAPTATPKPTTKPSSGGSGSGGSTGGGGSWYPTYAPRPTKVPVVPTATPTEAPVVTATPTPTETPEGTPTPTPHVHKWNVEAATCVTPKKCTDESCGFVAEDATGIHIFSEEGVVTKPTCTEAGYTTYKCLYCDESKQDSIVGSTGHTVTEWTIGELVENETCLYTQVGTCTTCGEKVTSETNVEKHSEELGTGVEEATCTVVGYKKYYCLDCGKTLKKEDYSNPEAHKWEIQADGTYLCANGCGATKKVVDMTDDGIDAETLDATTEIAVNTEGVSITLDSSVLAQVQTASGSAVTSTGGALKLSADVLSGEDKATAVGGLNDAALKEQIGDSDIYDFNMLVGDNPVSDFDGKVTVKIPYTLADGEDPDGIIVWYLTDDGEVESITGTYYDGFVTFKTNHFSYYTVVRMTPEQRCKLYGHIMLSATTNPTCTEDGYVTSICQRCAATEVTPGEKATGHNIVVEVIEEATCQHKGKHRHECNNKNCEFYTEVETPKGNHKPTKETGKKKEATCTEDGYIEYKCEDEKCTHLKKEIVKAKGHKRGDDGKCTGCGVDITCEHENHVLLVELQEGAKTCLDGVNVTKYCPECDSVVATFTTNEHYCKVIDLLNHWSYGKEYADFANSAGYMYLLGCACGEVAPKFGEYKQDVRPWFYDGYSVTDENGVVHYIETQECNNIMLKKEYTNLSQDGCDYTRDVTWSLIVDDKVVDSIRAEVVESSHYSVYEGKLSEGSKTCEDGVEGTRYCLYCGKEFGTWSSKSHRNCVVEAFDISKYSEDACGGYIIYYSCPCGENSNIDYWNNVQCNFEHGGSGTSENGINYRTETSTCVDCGFKYVNEYSVTPLENCRATRVGVLSFCVGDTVAETYEYSYEQDRHNSYYVVTLAEGNKSCLDGVNYEQYCYECGEKLGSGTRNTHLMGVKMRIDLSEYESTCGGEILFRSCACGEQCGLNTAKSSHNMVTNVSSKTDENGMEYWEETARCRDCEYNYIRKYTIAVGENCTAVQSEQYAFYVGDELIDTYAYSYNREYHDTYYSEAVLMEGSTTCEDGVTVTQKCRNCDYTWTGTRTGHSRVEKEVIDLADYGSACGGHIYVQECACGQNNNSTADFECDYGYSWDYILWNNYTHINDESVDGVDVYRAEYSCSVTDPACGFKFAMEQQVQPAVGCRREGIVYFCLDTDNDGSYETKYPVSNFWRNSHDTSGEIVETFETAEDGTKLKIETRTCAGCGEYKDVWTYADYLGDESYCYLIENAWGTEGDMYYDTYEYAFGEDCCSQTRIRTNDNGYYEELETRPACITDSVLTNRTCTQYATGVCKMCGNENALYPNNYGWPRKHSFTYNSETGLYECSRCGLENEKGVNGTITLEDMSDETNYIAGYWNGSQARGLNEVVFSVFVILHTEAEDIWTELEVTDAKSFDTGKVSISKADVAAYAATEGITDYDVMFSFVPKDASEDVAFNITFTEE